MKLFNYTILFLLLAFITSCEENEIDLSTPKKPLDLSNGYVKGYFDDQYLIFNKPKGPKEYFGNFYDPNNKYIFIAMDGEHYYSFGLLFSGYTLEDLKAGLPFKITNKTTLSPYVVDNFMYYPGVDMIFYDYRIYYDKVKYPEDNNYYTYRSYGNPVEVDVTFTKVEGHILEGTVSGTMRTKSGLVKTVKNAEFKVNLWLKAKN